MDVNSTALYRVRVSGCDDSTAIEIELTPAEADVVRRVADSVTAASGYQCQPTMTIRADDPANVEMEGE